jgi:NADH-quinone oxidoreductase subunit N
VFVSAESIRLLAPELILMIAATAICVGGAFHRCRNTWSLVGLLSFVLAGLAMTLSHPIGGSLSAGPVMTDGMSLTLRWLLIVAGMFFTSLAWQTASKELLAEQIGLTMFAVVGTMLVASAGDLIMLFLGLELISIPTYVLLFIGRKDREAAEASGKYFLLSILSSGLLLYGLSFLYGLGGTTALVDAAGQPAIRLALLGLRESPLAGLASVAMLLTIAGLGFKLAAVPFHFYAPDVYQGASAGTAALLATLPKIAASVGLVRIVLLALPLEANRAWQVLLVLSILSMLLGNMCALWQKNLRRMLAYSSISHSGYMLMGFTVAQASAATGGASLNQGIVGLLFYLAVYTFSSIGSFATLVAMGQRGREVNHLDELAGTGKTQPLAAAVMAIFMFSLAGIPPLAGFWGKFTLFTSAIGFALQPVGDVAGWMIALSIVGALNAAIGAAYYLRVVGVMYFQSASGEETTSTAPGGALATALACAILVVAAGIWPNSLMQGASNAEEHIAYQLKSVPRVAEQTSSKLASQNP